jgi:hypothetical protein
MPHRKRDRIGLALSAVLCLLLSPFAAAEDATLSPIVIPPELGRITHLVEASPATKRVILIQDAHQNIEAQRHIAAILAQLVERNGLTLILIEGGSGDVGLDRFRTMSTPEGRRELAEHFLKSGMASGPEYLAMTSSSRLILWGVEDPKLYASNFDAFLVQQKLGPELESHLDQLLAVVARELEQELSDDSKELRVKAAAFESGKLSLSDYVPFLLAKAAQVQIDVKSFPGLMRYAAMREAEQKLDLKSVNADQQALDREGAPIERGRLAGERVLRGARPLDAESAAEPKRLPGA